MRIYIDDGSTNIKMMWKGEDGKALRHMSPNSFITGWSVAFGNSDAANYEMGERKFSFNSNSAKCIRTTEVEYQYSDVNVIAIHHALHTSGIEPQPVEIVVTLPLSEYYDADMQANRVNIDRKITSVTRAVARNKEEAFIITSVTVRPESMPAGFKDAQVLKPNQSLLIIDIGGTTTDVSQVLGQMNGIVQIEFLTNVGVSIVTSVVKAALAKANTEASDYIINEMIKNRHDREFIDGCINDASQVDNVIKEIQSGINQLSEQVMEVVRRFHGFTAVTVAGGGAMICGQNIKSSTNIRDERFNISHDPQYDVVQGLYDIDIG
ncbi:hypothetical protein BS639_24015 [Rouxiella silvae]|uniref:Plasmid segregation protein ParM/StbA domain-containing protein n=1 Tax=Rouxiella silvae TaxID=1646373 RepID=A0ABX3TU39_9GAMM|nr:plasmid segregation protein ParM domain-containing protein [Rouxiella silvae]ORJ18673.1 hypothetical protein BS639_24015 [Rouxiella silvae]